MNSELLRIVEAMARDKNIDPEVVFEDLELAMVSAIRKANPDAEDIKVSLDRQSGDITAEVDGESMSIRDLGRIAAQTARQVMTQRIREAERELKYEEYAGREGDIVTGIIQQTDSRYTLLDLGRVEALLPQAEQVPYERPEPNSRRCPRAASRSSRSAARVRWSPRLRSRS